MQCVMSMVSQTHALVKEKLLKLRTAQVVTFQQDPSFYSFALHNWKNIKKRKKYLSSQHPLV